MSINSDCGVDFEENREQMAVIMGSRLGCLVEIHSARLRKGAKCLYLNLSRITGNGGEKSHKLGSLNQN